MAMAAAAPPRGDAAGTTGGNSGSGGGGGGAGAAGPATDGNRAERARFAAARATLDELVADLSSEKANITRFRELVKETGRIQADFSAHKKDLYKRGKALRALKTELASIKSGSGDAATEADVDEALELVVEAQKALCDVLSITPETGSLFTRLWLGRVNVRAPHKQDRLRLRDEYNKFKDRTNMMFIAFPVLRLLAYYKLSHTWQYTHWIYDLTHVWLLYYYVSLALRENILAVNGSDIRPWWIYHHYISAFMSVVVLTWPDGESYDSFNPQFSAFFLYQGVVQILQAWYQKRRHYVKLALKQVSMMDVASTETLTETPTELYALVLFIFSAHIFQVYNGVTLLHMVLATDDFMSKPWTAFKDEVQALTLGLLFLLLGCVNFHQVVTTLRDKAKRKHTDERVLRAQKSRASRKGASTKME